MIDETHILATIEREFEAAMQPATRAASDKVVEAGMRMAMNAKPGSGQKALLARLNESKDVVKSCAEGAAALVLYMWQEHNFNFPANVIPPSSVILMCKALDTAEKAGIIKVTNEDVGRGTKILGDLIMSKMGVTPDKFRKIAERVDQLTNDPTSMDLMARKSGMVKDPRASVPLDAVEEEVPAEEEETV